MSRDVQLIVIIEECRLSRILSCLLASLLLLSTQSKCFLEVPLFRSKTTALGCGSLLALLDRFIKVVVGGVTLRVLTRPSPSSFVLVPGFNIVNGRSRGHPIPHVSSRPSLFSQPSVVGKKIGDIFGLLTDICTLVLAILVDILELLEGLDNVDIVTEVDDDVLRASVQTVIEKSQRLK